MKLRAEVSGEIDLFEIHRRHPAVFPYLLQSVASPSQSGRFDLLFGFPGERLTGSAGLDALSRWSANERNRVPAEADLPFLGGWFVLLGYELAGAIEPRLRLPDSPFRLPDFLAVRSPAAMVYDRYAKRTTLLAESDAGHLLYMKNALQEFVSKIDISEPQRDSMLVDSVREEDPRRFLDGVTRVLDYLRAGDAFQVNLSRRWRGRLRPGIDAHQLYPALRRANPAPFAGLATVDGVSVLSSSPERLVSAQGRRVQTRPIAGTRARGIGDGDRALLRELIGSLKERAEHVMLLDLERNDLGRVCEPGSVRVNELMSLETYAHVHHIVSNVEGRLRPDVGPGEILRAVFPGGTITGCPKVRAMELIAELEGEGRGPYTGAMGYLSRCGNLDTNILIRSLVVQDGEVSFRAGAGIVADSRPEAELAETRAKARGLLLALGVEL